MRERDLRRVEAIRVGLVPEPVEQRYSHRPVAVVARHIAYELPRAALVVPPPEQLVHIGVRPQMTPTFVPCVLPTRRRLRDQGLDVARALERLDSEWPERAWCPRRQVHGLEVLEVLVGAQPVEIGILAQEPIAPPGDVRTVGMGGGPREPRHSEFGEVIT